jgi:hypothetical protein
MATIDCQGIDELHQYKQAVERGALLAKNIVLACKIPFAYFSVILNSIHLFFMMEKYFRTVSIQKFEKCCNLSEPKCRECLRSIYNDENLILKKSLKMQNMSIIDWVFKRIIMTLEDRAETLILIVNDPVAESINKLINNLDKGALPQNAWQDQLNAF